MATGSCSGPGCTVIDKATTTSTTTTTTAATAPATTTTSTTTATTTTTTTELTVPTGKFWVQPTLEAYSCDSFSFCGADGAQKCEAVIESDCTAINDVTSLANLFSTTTTCLFANGPSYENKGSGSTRQIGECFAYMQTDATQIQAAYDSSSVDYGIGNTGSEESYATGCQVTTSKFFYNTDPDANCLENGFTASPLFFTDYDCADKYVMLLCNNSA